MNFPKLIALASDPVFAIVWITIEPVTLGSPLSIRWWNGLLASASN